MTKSSFSLLLTGFAAAFFSVTLAAQSTPASRPDAHEHGAGCCASMEHSTSTPSATHEHGAATKRMSCAMCAAAKDAKARPVAAAESSSHEKSAREADAYAKSWRASKSPNAARLAERWEARATEHRVFAAETAVAARPMTMPKMDCMEMASAK